MPRDPFLVVFDLDGTLVDSAAMITASMAAAFETCGLAAPESGAVRRVVGLALDHAIAALAPHQSPDVHNVLVGRYKAAFTELRAARAVGESLFPGADEAVRRLSAQGYALGVATGKSRAGMTQTLEIFGLRRYFDTVQNAEDSPGKPHPAMVEQAMAETGIERARTVVVGDTTFDMELAANAGVAAVGVSWGNHDADVLRAAGAGVILERFDDLDRILEHKHGPPPA